MNTDALSDFTRYVEKQIKPSVTDISGLSNQSRKHVQKLIYTNLVDRFDVMVDHLILDNCRHENIRAQISRQLGDSVKESDLLHLLMDAENLQEAIDNRLKDAIRNTILRKRHSLKVQAALKLFEHIEYTKSKPYVSPGNGKIISTPKQYQVNVPQSVCGYADWLYSRRNGIVHGTGSSFLTSDKSRLKELYKYNCPSSFKMKIGATNTAVKFYLCMAEILKTEA